MTGDKSLSEELFQAVFLAVWMYRRRYRFPRSFRAWLFGIAVNKCRAALRRRGEPAVSLELAGVPAPLTAARSPVEDAVAGPANENAE